MGSSQYSVNGNKRKVNMDTVTTFIRKRFSKDCHWLDGNCYYFALILKDRFNGKIYYDSVNGHFITLINGQFYDWTGRIHPNIDDIFDWDTLEKIDNLYYKRIVKDCCT